MNNEKYIDEEGKIAVLHSTAYGKPWTSDEQDRTLIETLLFDKKLVEMVIERKEIYSALDYLETKNIFLCKDKDEKGMDFFLAKSCWQSLQIKKISPGIKFFVSNYDGVEDIIITDKKANNEQYFTA